MTRYIAFVLSLAIAATGTPIVAQAQTTAAGCAAGRKTEHFSTVDLWDVIRVLSDDYRIPMHPALSLPHVNVDTDLTCYTRDMAIEFLQGMGLNLVQVGTPASPVLVVYPSTEGQRLTGDVRYFHLKYASPDSDFISSLRDALPLQTYIAARKTTDTVVVSGSPSALARAAQVIEALDQPTSALAAKTVPVLSGIPVSDVITALGRSFPGASLVADNADNSVIISGPPETVAAAEKAVLQFSRGGWQIRLDVRVADVFPNNDSSNTGFAFGGVNAQGQQTPGSGSGLITIPGFSLSGNITVNLNVSKGMTEVFDGGSFTTFNNKKLSFDDATNYPFNIVDPLTGSVLQQPTKIGLLFSATPTVSSDGKNISMVLHIEESEFGGYTPQNAVISIERTADTTLNTTDGQPVAIVDLMEDSSSDTLQKVPVLGNIPLLGALFSYRSKTLRKGHIALLVTPHVSRVL